MIFILHRYIFREIFRVFVLATIALTLMMSLGSILRPVQEYGAGPQQVIHLMIYFLPVTLTFVLPMAALFAASLVYGRFASDNELDACRASGISLMTLVYPGFALAIIVATANLILSFYVMPAFVHRAEKSLKADAKQILFRNIQRKGYYRLPPDNRYRIYADLAMPQNNMLLGVVVTELKNQGIERIITAESAKVQFNPHDRFNEVQIIARNTYQTGSQTEGGFYAEWMSLTSEFGSLMGDDIKFKKVDEMKKIRLDLIRFYPIEKLARETYAQFTAELLAEDIAEKTTDPNSPYKLYSDKKRVEFTAAQCKPQDDKKIELTKEVRAVEYDTGGEKPLITLQASRAMLHLEGDELAPTLTLELYNPIWNRPDGSQGMAQRYVVRGLILPKTVKEKFKTTDILQIITPTATAATLTNAPTDELIMLQNKLHRKILKTLAEIKAEMHSRLVFGVGCIPLIMIGIGLGIIKKGGHLLSAFGVSSLPAVVLVVCMLMGTNITKNLGVAQQVSSIGTLLMWSGPILLFLLAFIIYHRLLRS